MQESDSVELYKDNPVIEDPVIMQTLRTHNARLKLRRREYGLSQIALSELAEVPITYISEFENLKRFPKSEKDLVYASRIAETLGTTFDYLFPGIVGLLIENDIQPKITRLVTQKQIEEYRHREIGRLSAQNNPEIRLIGTDLRFKIIDCLKDLKEQEALVVDLYYGLGATPLSYRYNRPLSTNEIADIMEVSRQRVNQIRNNAIHKMRFSRDSANLKSYLEELPTQS